MKYMIEDSDILKVLKTFIEHGVTEFSTSRVNYEYDTKTGYVVTVESPQDVLAADRAIARLQT